MVEGRISAGVVVGDGSDVGGGASIMGTLSGGGTRGRSRVGQRCLIGANAGIGISLGDDCVVEAGSLRHRRRRRSRCRTAASVKARRAVRPRRPAVPAQQRHRRARGAPAHRQRRRAQRRPARQRLRRDGMPDAHARTVDRRRRGRRRRARRASSGIRALWHAAQTHFAVRHCTVGDYDLDTDQAAVASTMVGAVTKYTPPLPERAARPRPGRRPAGEQAAQPRARRRRPRLGRRAAAAPVAGLGHRRRERLTDVHEATREFLAALVKVAGLAERCRWPTRSRPCRSRPTAAPTPSTRTRRRRWPTRCSATRPAGDRVHASTSRPRSRPRPQVVAQLRRPAAASTAAARTAGRSACPAPAGQTAAWFVANADRLGIDSVAYDGKRWTRARRLEGRAAASGRASAAMLADADRSRRRPWTRRAGAISGAQCSLPGAAAPR